MNRFGQLGTNLAEGRLQPLTTDGGQFFFRNQIDRTSSNITEICFHLPMH
ncbi:MAG: hypothetical protein MK234_07645 [Nitrospinales bacterium]|nr:hypothetical protein [Nitrospinales bacterium]